MIKFFVNRRLFTASIFAVLLLVGLFSLSNLPLDFLPNMEIPTLTISTAYPGASAEDVETTISKVIEDAVATVPNIDKITSNSQENYSTVTISFKWGTDLSAASSDVRDKLDAARANLPEDAEQPVIFKFDLSQIPVLVLGISADRSFRDLYRLVDKKISNDLKKVPGVGMVSFSGGLERQINVEIDRKRLEAYRLSLAQVNSAISRSNMNVPAGSIKLGGLEYSVRIPGEYADLAEIAGTIVGSFQGRNIYLSDISDVKDSFKEQTNMTEVNGNPGMRMIIQKESGTNSVDVARAVHRALDRMKTELPPDVTITTIMDTSESIVRQIGELTRTLGWSFLFVVLTVLFFLRNFRGAVIVSMAIPFSLIAAFVYLFISGGSINIISLASIIIALGVVVDDAIVIMENIYRHRDEKKEPAREAAIYGAGEVTGAVIASTTTSVVIFFPMLVIGGFVAIFFAQLSMISIVVISMSLFTALSLTPMLCSVLLKPHERGGAADGPLEAFYDRSEAAFRRMEEGYRFVLTWALNNRKPVIIGAFAVFFLSMPLFFFTGSEFLPQQDMGTFSATIAMPPGTRWEETAAAMRRIEAEVKKGVPELEYILVSAGSSGQAHIFSSATGPNYGSLYVKVVPLGKRKRGIRQIERQVSDIALSIPGLKSVDFSAGGANALIGNDKPITIEIYGDDFNVIQPIADDLQAKISRIRGVVDPTISREKTNPEFSLRVDRAKASSLGLTMADIAYAVRGGLYGNAVTKFREDGDEYDIFTRFEEKDRKDLKNVKNAVITTPQGVNVTLGNIADVQLRLGPQTIQRKNQQRIIKVSADFYGRSLGDILSDVRSVISRTSIPLDVSIKLGGSAESIKESFSRLGLALFMGICLIYLVMVAQFESLLDPFIIMFAIPFAVVGVVWSLFLTGSTFGVMSFIGLIMVTGIAVKNSVVLVDYTNILRARGMELRDAIVQAGRTRLRPILMTSSTTMLGLMPIVASFGEGAGFWKTMAISVIGGLIVSATISLVFVPTLYYVIETRIIENPSMKRFFSRRQTV